MLNINDMIANLDDLSDKDLERLRGMAIGLIFECPYGNNPPDCQLHRIRQLSIEERFQWFSQLSVQELVNIYHHHLICSANKREG